ncbi:MAG TPA: hypothetical protein VFA16_22420, partial [Mycobacterium sp.]
QRPHFLNANQTVTIGGTNYTVSSTGLTATAFQVTSGTPTGSAVTYHVSAAWTQIGVNDSQMANIYVYATTHVPGRRGILFGNNGAGGAASGTDIANIHVYNNFDVAGDIVSGGVTISNGQFEGPYKCCLIMRGGNGRNTYRGRLYGGQGGNTLLSMRDSNHNIVQALMHQGGSGNAAPSGFNNVYWESYGSGDNTIDLMMEHDFNTSCKAAQGQAPGTSYVRAHMNSYSGGTVTADWGTLASPLWHYYAAPTGTTLVTN